VRYDLPAQTKSERPSLYCEVDGHWNAAGHAFVARMLMEHLGAHGFLDDVLKGETGPDPSSTASSVSNPPNTP